MAGKASTPPHHPTYHVHLSPVRINHIVAALYPHHTAGVTEAPHGTSYNNRIYFLDIIPESTNPTTEPTNPTSKPVRPFRVVLKVSGHFFNETKIQSEVGSLLLLARHCPSIPAPLVLAWSENGQIITTFEKSVPDTSFAKGDGRHGWILMTRLPGRTLTEADLDGPYGSSLLNQISYANAIWRTAIPRVHMFGNVRYLSSTESCMEDAVSWKLGPLYGTFTAGGFLLCHRYDPTPIRTLSAYYTYMLKDQTHRVMTSNCYDAVRCDLVPVIAEFVEQDLDRLSCLHRPTNDESPIGVFSHMDLAPRNILVDFDSKTGELTVKGIIDFEFAAFLPELDEFVNAYVRQEGDWTEKHRSALMQELANRGCRVPPLEGVKADKTWSKTEWKEVCLLWKLIDNIAPWYVMEGRMEEEELNEVLRKAGKIVRESIKELQTLIGVKKGTDKPAVSD